MKVLGATIGTGQLTLQQPSALTLSQNGGAMPVNTANHPGFVRGWSIPDGYGRYTNELYTAFGDGAGICAYISDNSDYTLATERTLLPPKTVSSTSSTFDVRGLSWFDLSSLTGKYINIVGDDRAQIASVQL